MAERSPYPAVPVASDRNLGTVVRALKGVVDVMLGRGGRVEDRVVTVGDLVDLGLVDLYRAKAVLGDRDR